MALDGIILSKVREDLERKLPIRINRISDTSLTEVVLNVHAEGVRTNLVISLHSDYNHITLSDRNYATHNDPSTFVMVLRKYLQNGIIHKISQSEYDRYLLMEIRALDDLYDQKEYILSVELMGKYANLILVDKKTCKIIDALKKIPPFENSRRTILQGALFTLPDRQNKKDFFTCDDIDFDQSLVAQLQGFSKTLEKEVRFRLQSQTLEEIREEIRHSDKLYLTEINGKYEYHVIPLRHLGDDYEEYPLEEGFDRLYYSLDEKERIKNITDDIFKFVKRQLKHYSSKIEKLNISMEDALNLDDYKENGDLIYTYGDLNKKGLSEVTIYDKKIKLDPKISLKDNARKFYQQYQKKRKGQAYIAEQLEIAQKECDYFTSLFEQLSLANFNDAVDIREELTRNGYLRVKNKKKNVKRRINLYRIHVDGHVITFGKNNIQNEYCTFEYAKASYTWFHAKDYHGAHVVVDCSEPDEKLIRICANIAAFYSKGRLSSSVPVDYTLAKNVKKIPGSKPGFVSYKNHKTIYIDPCEDRDLVIEAV